MGCLLIIPNVRLSWAISVSNCDTTFITFQHAVSLYQYCWTGQGYSSVSVMKPLLIVVVVALLRCIHELICCRIPDVQIRAVSKGFVQLLQSSLPAPWIRAVGTRRGQNRSRLEGIHKPEKSITINDPSRLNPTFTSEVSEGGNFGKPRAFYQSIVLSKSYLRNEQLHLTQAFILLIFLR